MEVTTSVENSIDTVFREDATIIFVRRDISVTTWYEDSTEIKKLRRDIDSIEKATYLVTKNTTVFQQKHQKNFELYKGLSFVAIPCLVTTIIFLIAN